MKSRTTVLTGTFALIFGAQLAVAQTVYRPRTGMIAAPARQGQPANQPQPQASNRPRIGWIVPAPPVVPQQNGAMTAGFANGAPQVTAFYYVPTVVLTDGRVFGNFNGTYEQVLRRCPITSGPVPPGFATPACWYVDTYGRYQIVQGR
jgi:hypothetical protein